MGVVTRPKGVFIHFRPEPPPPPMEARGATVLKCFPVVKFPTKIAT